MMGKPPLLLWTRQHPEGPQSAREQGEMGTSGQGMGAGCAEPRCLIPRAGAGYLRLYVCEGPATCMGMDPKHAPLS